MINTAGIVLVGYIGDKTWISPSLLYASLICCSGVSVALIPLLSSYHFLAILSSLYGLTISANYALTSVILVDLISLDKFTIGYGLLLLVQGIASLIGPPLAGKRFSINPPTLISLKYNSFHCLWNPLETQLSANAELWSLMIV